MGLLDTLIHAATGGGSAPSAGGGSIQSAILSHVLGMVGGQGGGGLGALVQKLTAGGLGPQVSSWVGTGPNQPVSPAQVQAALQQARTNLAEGAVLRGVVIQMKRRLDALEAAQRQSPPPANFPTNEPPDSLSP